MGQTISVPLGELTATPLMVPLDQLQVPDAPSSSSALWFQGAARALPAAERVTKAALDAPNAPRVIQRAIGAAVRGASTATGAAIGGVPGAVGGAAMSEGLTPTQQTIRGWLGRTSQAAQSAAPSRDAVVNYVESMGADVNNLKGGALEYATKAGRPVLYDASGAARLVPTAEAVATSSAAPAKAASKFFVGKLASALSTLSGVQGALDLAQMADPNRKDISFLGLSANGGPIDSAHPPMMNAAIAAIAERMGRPDIADLWRGKKAQ